MSHADTGDHERTQKALTAVNKYINTLFDRAPVMMHSLDSDCRLIRVNRRWLQRLQYKRDEVLGRKSIDFLTDASRAWALKDTLPLFWRVGSARSVGYEFVTKNGRPVDVLLDAEALTTARGDRFTLAALRKGHNLTQWEQASTTLAALQQLTRMRLKLAGALSPRTSGNEGQETTAGPQPSGRAFDADLERQALGALLEVGQDISANLRGLLRVHEEWLGTTVEQQLEILNVAKSIERSLADLAHGGDSSPDGRLEKGTAAVPRPSASRARYSLDP